MWENSKIHAIGNITILPETALTQSSHSREGSVVTVVIMVIVVIVVRSGLAET